MSDTFYVLEGVGELHAWPFLPLSPALGLFMGVRNVSNCRSTWRWKGAQVDDKCTQAGRRTWNHKIHSSISLPRFLRLRWECWSRLLRGQTAIICVRQSPKRSLSLTGLHTVSLLQLANLNRSFGKANTGSFSFFVFWAHHLAVNESGH